MMSDLISRQAAIDAIGEVHPLDYNRQAILERIKALPSAQPEWNNHTVACLLAELYDDTCACNYNGIDEWLPEKCELLDSCPNPEKQLVKMKSRENLFMRASASALRNKADYAKWQTGDGGRTKTIISVDHDDTIVLTWALDLYLEKTEEILSGVDNDFDRVIRCKNCSNANEKSASNMYRCSRDGKWHDEDWYCADGEHGGN